MVQCSDAMVWRGPYMLLLHSSWSCRTVVVVVHLWFFMAMDVIRVPPDGTVSAGGFRRSQEHGGVMAKVDDAIGQTGMY